jgi:hypothetical protein
MTATTHFEILGIGGGEAGKHAAGLMCCQTFLNLGGWLPSWEELQRRAWPIRRQRIPSFRTDGSKFALSCLAFDSRLDRGMQLLGAACYARRTLSMNTALRDADRLAAHWWRQGPWFLGHLGYRVATAAVPNGMGFRCARRRLNRQASVRPVGNGHPAGRLQRVQHLYHVHPRRSTG